MAPFHRCVTTLLILVVIVVLPRRLDAQTIAVSGVVVDARTGQPLAAVLIQVEGQPSFVESDAAGRFEMAIAPGRSIVTASLIGYALLRVPLDLAPGVPAAPLRIELSEGAGAFEEHVTVSGAVEREADAAPAGAILHGRDLQALRGITLDDPLRALHALPSAAATDDLYSEFAVRGLDFRHTLLAVDGIPSPYLMHAVHGVRDGGSIAMLNSDVVASVGLLPGSYPQRIGRRLGAEVDVTTREGDRQEFRARAGLSGTSATVLLEGPLGGSRGSWLVSGRRSYLDLLLNRIDEENSLAFGFSDVLSKVVVDLTPRQQMQALAIFGASRFDEKADDLGPNDEARVAGRSWLSGLSWRYTPAAKLSMTQRVYATGLIFNNTNTDGDALDRSRNADFGWRGDVLITPRAGLSIELGADAQRATARHTVRRSLNDAPTLSTLGDYRSAGTTESAYGQITLTVGSRLTIAPGARLDHWPVTGTATTSPWINTEWVVTSGTRLRAGAGVYWQFADLEQIHGVRGGGASLRPETATHVDVSLEQTLPRSSRLQIAWFARDERDVLWTPGAEPRLNDIGAIQLGRGDAKWVNALDGRARGVEILLRRDAPSGLAGWAGYAFTRHTHTHAPSSEAFPADVDQRHGLSLFGRYPISNRTSVGAKFRYGSNYPRVGYIAEQEPPVGAPTLFGGARPLWFALSATRNALRLPAYARLDLRADRTFNWSRRRFTVFVEVANALNRRNLRNVPYDVDRNGRINGGTDSMMPVLPSAGFVIEF